MHRIVFWMVVSVAIVLCALNYILDLVMKGVR